MERIFSAIHLPGEAPTVKAEAHQLWMPAQAQSDREDSEISPSIVQGFHCPLLGRFTADELSINDLRSL